jgi:glycosyltransferase involved in cell wall biosynthesis
VLLHHYPKANPRHWVIRWLWYKLPLRKADAVTVISENTRRDLLYFTGCSPDKIRIIPNFIDPLFVARPRPFSLHRSRLLFIGTAPNKNLERTAEAVCGLDVELIIVGYLNAAQAANLSSKHIRYQLLNKLSDQEMKEAYAEADIMIFPSTYEGFGLPIIEAQATGRPVLTSRLEPMRSVAGDAACLVDPYSVESIRNGIKRIIENESYRNELVEKGFSNIKRFQLGNVTKLYTDLYHELIERKGI